MARTFTTVEITNTISGCLGHYHTLDSVEGIGTMRELQAAWIAAGEARAAEAAAGSNADLFVGALSPGIIGWNVMEGEGYYILRHTTSSGRLDIAAEDDAVELVFMAGPDPFGQPSTGGRLVALVILRPTENGLKVKPEVINPSLLEGRPDRVGLLSEIDRALEGAVVEGLRQNRSSDALALIEAMESEEEVVSFSVERGLDSLCSPIAQAAARAIMDRNCLASLAEDVFWVKTRRSYPEDGCYLIRGIGEIGLIFPDCKPRWLAVGGGNAAIEAALRREFAVRRLEIEAVHAARVEALRARPPQPPQRRTPRGAA